MLTIILAVIAFLCFVEYFVNNSEYAKTIKRIPGFKDYFFFGNALCIFGLNAVGLFKLGRDAANTNNGIYRFFALSIAGINIYKPEDVEIVTSSMKHHEKSFIYSFLRPWLMDGLLLSKGHKWQGRRKILTSAFHFNILRKYFPTLEANSQKLVKLLSNTNEDSLDIVPVISEYTLDSISETAMGVQLNKDEEHSGTVYKNAIYAAIETFIYRFLRIYFYFDILFEYSPKGIQQFGHLKIIHKFIKNVINKRKDYVNNNNKIMEYDNDANNDIYELGYKRKKRAAMLDLLIAAEKEGLIDDKGIQEEVNTFMFEGHDTTAAGLTFCLLMLAEHQDVQAKALEECQDIFRGRTDEATLEDLAKMNYLERCIKETMRLYPPVPFISRSLSEPVVLSGYEIPEGTMCHIHIFDLHRQESLFKNALKFDPDRFLPENSVGRHPYAYIPFSAGPRNCIGQKFAMMEMKSAVSAILREFKILPVTTSEDLEFAADLVLRTSKPIYLKFVKRY